MVLVLNVMVHGEWKEFLWLYLPFQKLCRCYTPQNFLVLFWWEQVLDLHLLSYCFCFEDVMESRLLSTNKKIRPKSCEFLSGGLVCLCSLSILKWLDDLHLNALQPRLVLD